MTPLFRAYAPICARDVKLAAALGATVRPTESKNIRTNSVTEVSVASAVKACREAARANKVSAIMLATRIKKCISGVAASYDALDYSRTLHDGESRSRVTHPDNPLFAAQQLAALLGVPWVLGPLRVLPRGAFEITLGAEWLPATEDLLRALDAEARLGAQPKVVNIAVETLLARMKGTP